MVPPTRTKWPPSLKKPRAKLTVLLFFSLYMSLPHIVHRKYFRALKWGKIDWDFEHMELWFFFTPTHPSHATICLKSSCWCSVHLSSQLLYLMTLFVGLNWARVSLISLKMPLLVLIKWRGLIVWLTGSKINLLAWSFLEDAAVVDFL